jgi:hypothetical protein
MILGIVNIEQNKMFFCFQNWNALFEQIFVASNCGDFLQ